MWHQQWYGHDTSLLWWRELSIKTNLPIYNPTLTYRHALWIGSERWVCGCEWWKWASSEGDRTRRGLKSLCFAIEKSQLRGFRHPIRISTSCSGCFQPRGSCGVDLGNVGEVTFLGWLGKHLSVSPKEQKRWMSTDMSDISTLLYFSLENNFNDKLT